MPKVTREQLAGYLDDALSEAETAQVEQALRESEPLRRQLRTLMQERDRGEHSLGAIWQRQRLSCPSRDQLGGFLLGALDAAWRDYIDFHLHTIGCSYCLANLADLQALQKEPTTKTRERRQRIYKSSAGLLKPGRNKRK
jgi:hypothetical protein